jgi:glutaminase
MSTDPRRQMFEPIEVALEELRERYLPDDRGEVADDIPELAKADPGHFGLSLVSVDGHRYRAGDTDVAFTMQSISKPFVYALALADHGLEAMLDRVGAEPSGEAYNAISLDPDTGRPDNPMINAGAIVSASLVAGAGAEERFERIRTTLSGFAGRDLALDDRVYRSEMATGDRNRALAYLMRSTGALGCPVDEAIEVYFRQCALSVTADDIATMGATLANNGENPVTGQRVIPEEVDEQVMAVMATCGMYDSSGEWLVRVGLPAKSGVAGGLMALSPAQFGIGLYSPPLDAKGNSVRAVEACRDLSADFSLHLLHRPARDTPVVSLRMPDNDEPAVLCLRGDVDFVGAEQALRSLDPVEAHWAEHPGPHELVLDLARVSSVEPVAAAMFEALAAGLAESGVRLSVADPRRRALLAELPEREAP